MSATEQTLGHPDFAALMTHADLAAHRRDPCPKEPTNVRGRGCWAEARAGAPPPAGTSRPQDWRPWPAGVRT